VVGGNNTGNSSRLDSGRSGRIGARGAKSPRGSAIILNRLSWGFIASIYMGTRKDSIGQARNNLLDLTLRSSLDSGGGL